MQHLAGGRIMRTSESVSFRAFEGLSRRMNLQHLAGFTITKTSRSLSCHALDDVGRRVNLQHLGGLGSQEEMGLQLNH